MRLWSLHPAYLDSKGLVALWREALLAQAVLNGKTIGYRNHPQLQRFKQHKRPCAAIATYLISVYEEATKRGYNFNKSKILPDRIKMTIPVSSKQLAYEVRHLQNKLKIRDPNALLKIKNNNQLKPHPLFRIYTGPIESWEIID